MNRKLSSKTIISLILAILIFLIILSFIQSYDKSIKIGVLSDIHADKENLQYFIKELKKEKVDAIIISGDIVEHFRNNISDYDELNHSLFILAQQKATVFILPGNHENQADYAQLVEYYKTVNSKIIDLATQNSVVFDKIIIIGFPGYENKDYNIDNGFLLENQRIKSIIEEAKQKYGSNNKEEDNLLTNKLLIVSHGPPKGKNVWSIDALADGKNVGNIYLDQIMKQEDIRFSISGHIHEAGQKAVNEEDELIAENEWSSSLRLNAGSLTAWKMNSGSVSQGSAAILEIKGEKAKYSVIRK